MVYKSGFDTEFVALLELNETLHHLSLWANLHCLCVVPGRVFIGLGLVVHYDAYTTYTKMPTQLTSREVALKKQASWHPWYCAEVTWLWEPSPKPPALIGFGIASCLASCKWR